MISKRCTCGKEIWIEQINKKILAYEDKNKTIVHARHYQNNQNIIIKKLHKIESDISTIYGMLDNHSIQLEKIVNDVNELRIRNE